MDESEKDNSSNGEESRNEEESNSSESESENDEGDEEEVDGEEDEEEVDGEEDEEEDDEETIESDQNSELSEDDDDDEKESVEDAIDDSKEVCPVCLNHFIGQDLGSPENCSHIFCLECILEWSKNVNTCPIDRTEFNRILVRLTAAGDIIRKIKVKMRPKEPEDALPEDNSVCEVCHLGDREDRLLLCDSCDLAYHCECLTPPLRCVPVNEWFCPPCSVVLDKKPAATSSRRRRIIPRTIASEVIRTRIQRLRTGVAEGNDGYFEQPSTTSKRTNSTRVGSLTVRKRKVVRRRRRRTTKTRRKYTPVKRARTKASASRSKTSGKSSLGSFRSRTRTWRRRKPRRRRRTKRTRTSSTRTKRSCFASRRLAMPSTKSRIADRLGLYKSSQGESIPYVKKPSGSSGSTVTETNFHRIFGDKNQLMDFDEDFTKHELPEVLIKTANTALQSSGNSTACGSGATSVDILGSIFQGQSLLTTNSSKITIGADGSLKLNSPQKNKIVRQLSPSTTLKREINIHTVKEENRITFNEVPISNSSSKPTRLPANCGTKLLEALSKSNAQSRFSTVHSVKEEKLITFNEVPISSNSPKPKPLPTNCDTKLLEALSKSNAQSSFSTVRNNKGSQGNYLPTDLVKVETTSAIKVEQNEERTGISLVPKTPIGSRVQKLYRGREVSELSNAGLTTSKQATNVWEHDKLSACGKGLSRICIKVEKNSERTSVETEECYVDQLHQSDKFRSPSRDTLDLIKTSNKPKINNNSYESTFSSKKLPENAKHPVIDVNQRTEKKNKVKQLLADRPCSSNVLANVSQEQHDIVTVKKEKGEESDGKFICGKETKNDEKFIKAEADLKAYGRKDHGKKFMPSVMKNDRSSCGDIHGGKRKRKGEISIDFDSLKGHSSAMRGLQSKNNALSEVQSHKNQHHNKQQIVHSRTVRGKKTVNRNNAVYEKPLEADRSSRIHPYESLQLVEDSDTFYNAKNNKSLRLNEDEHVRTSASKTVEQANRLTDPRILKCGKIKQEVEDAELHENKSEFLKHKEVVKDKITSSKESLSKPNNAKKLNSVNICNETIGEPLPHVIQEASNNSEVGMAHGQPQIDTDKYIHCQNFLTVPIPSCQISTVASDSIINAVGKHIIKEKCNICMAEITYGICCCRKPSQKREMPHFVQNNERSSITPSNDSSMLVCQESGSPDVYAVVTIHIKKEKCNICRCEIKDGLCSCIGNRKQSSQCNVRNSVVNLAHEISTGVIPTQEFSDSAVEATVNSQEQPVTDQFSDCQNHVKIVVRSQTEISGRNNEETPSVQSKETSYGTSYTVSTDPSSDLSYKTGSGNLYASNVESAHVKKEKCDICRTEVIDGLCFCNRSLQNCLSHAGFKNSLNIKKNSHAKLECENSGSLLPIQEVPNCVVGDITEVNNCNSESTRILKIKPTKKETCNILEIKPIKKEICNMLEIKSIKKEICNICMAEVVNGLCCCSRAENNYEIPHDVQNNSLGHGIPNDTKDLLGWNRVKNMHNISSIATVCIKQEKCDICQIEIINGLCCCNTTVLGSFTESTMNENSGFYKTEKHTEYFKDQSKNQVLQNNNITLKSENNPSVKFECSSSEMHVMVNGSSAVEDTDKHYNLNKIGNVEHTKVKCLHEVKCVASVLNTVVVKDFSNGLEKKRKLESDTDPEKKKSKSSVYHQNSHSDQEIVLKKSVTRNKNNSPKIYNKTMKNNKDMTENVEMEIKKILKPYYVKREITKEVYKEIMRRCVPKILSHPSSVVDVKKIEKLVLQYIEISKRDNGFLLF